MRRNIAIDAAMLTDHYQVSLAGIVCSVATNSALVGKALSSWPIACCEGSRKELSMRVLVTGEKGTDISRPHFRGLHHLVIATFGPANIFTFDLIRRSVTGIISEEIAADAYFWNRILVPIVLGVLGTSVGIVPIHCACLSLGGMGILIGGASGAGKSTLSVALAQSGFDYVSDDWTYLSEANGSLVAYGLSVPAKLLPDAVDSFPELVEYPLRMALNQELSYDLPLENLGAQVKPSCEPHIFVLLERAPHKGFQLEPLSSDAGRQYILRSVEPLPRQLRAHIQTRKEMIDRIAYLRCWRLIYGGPPQTAVTGMHEFLQWQLGGVPA